MGMKDQQRQDQGQWQQKGKDKLGQARERAGQQPGQPQRGQRPQQGQQPNRGRQDMDDMEMQDRLDHDYDA
ncbi:hypothetical protein ACF09H_20535 [Streptomyces sp. NPDC014983]|uniref:hypothetical protein n=1 Tax=unclassified Streptomyces TaxID=2593676 RepID=UPI0024A19FE2|nr:hypothetical protein [Streptomyces hygroscopicus]GLX54204.1 hypothetical protein Shyhy01_71530 [Streptomyces hygroscopicus subsp. hygroscopicus]